jgi:cardiolipin synthase
MTIPNLLSVLRLFITIFFIIAIYEDRMRTALLLFLLQAFTDLLDGFLARTMGSKTRLGAFLDPLADKAMLLSAYVVLNLKGIVPLWLTWTVLLRDIVLVTGFAVLYKLSLQGNPMPSYWGKMTTFFQILTIVYILWSMDRTYAPFFFYPTALITVISGIHYVSRGIRIISKTS